ncbi:MAG: SprT family zinc-dependent metalloprotease [Flavobacteriales bacterium]
MKGARVVKEAPKGARGADLPGRPTTLNVRYGSRTLEFSLRRSERRTLGIEVHPDLSVHVVAPMNAALPTIEAKVVAKGRWLLKQFRHFEEFLPRTPPREYVSGESHSYLGRRYVLKVRSGKERSVKLKGGELVVTLPERNDREQVRQLVAAWYRAHAQRVFAERLEEALNLFKRHKLEEPPVRITRMAKRWGSCTPQGRMLLNPDLITMPVRAIDYVITHELCHLVHPYHNKAFHALQRRVMPDAQRWKDRLERA